MGLSTYTNGVDFAYDYSDEVVSEYIGLYLDTNRKELLEQLTNQYSDYTGSTDAAIALVRIWKKEEETLLELACRVLRLAKIAYKGAFQREGKAMQVQLTKYYTDAIPASLAKAFR